MTLTMRTGADFPSFLVAYLLIRFPFAHLDPHLTLLVLAFGTMTVTAAVVAGTYLTALRTCLDMTSEGSCTADSHYSN